MCAGAQALSSPHDLTSGHPRTAPPMFGAVVRIVLETSDP